MRLTEFEWRAEARVATVCTTRPGVAPTIALGWWLSCAVIDKWPAVDQIEHRSTTATALHARAMIAENIGGKCSPDLKYYIQW